ncbi:ABC transporter permease [Fontibacillus sp. BL9]|uniref:ABC transporter permease n=1 Tax=Fontibacillus sp. BL9 TaxID=3389971 RepID=UPI00397C6E5D
MSKWHAVTMSEFHMQLRRIAPWLSMLILFGLYLWDSYPGTSNLARLSELNNHYYVAQRTSELFGEFFVIIAAVLTSDRILRDRNLRVAEIIMSSPLSRFSYITGKYAGNVLALLLVCFVFNTCVALTQAFFNPEPFIVTPYAEAFLLIFLPSVLFAVGLSMAGSTILGSAKGFSALFLVYAVFCLTKFYNSYETPFYQLVADAPKLIFYSGRPENLPYQSAYMNLMFLFLAGPIAVALLILIKYRKGRAV